MTRFTQWCLVVLAAGAVAATPAKAQSRGGFSSLTHTVSVTVPPRVKVKVSTLSLTSSRYASLGLIVEANRAWVVASAEGVLASGTASSAVDTKLAFRSASKPTAGTAGEPILLTVSAP